MSEFKPVTTMRELALLDGDEVAAGYVAGMRGEPEPGNLRSRSFHHGWRNGAVDGGYREKDSAQAALAADVCARMPRS